MADAKEMAAILKEIRTMEENNRKEEEKKKAQDIRVTKRYEEVQKAGFKRTPESGTKDLPLEEIVKEKILKAFNTEAYAYNDWRAAILGLLSMCKDFSEYLANERRKAFFTVENAIKEGAYDKYDAFLEKITGTPEIDIPSLTSFVEVNQNGELKVDLIRSDTNENLLNLQDTKLNPQDPKVILSSKLTQMYTEVVSDWLVNDHKYTKSGNKFTKNQVDLNSEEFKKLVNDPQKGLSKYIFDNLKHEELKLNPPQFRK